VPAVLRSVHTQRTRFQTLQMLFALLGVCCIIEKMSAVRMVEASGSLEGVYAPPHPWPLSLCAADNCRRIAYRSSSCSHYHYYSLPPCTQSTREILRHSSKASICRAVHLDPLIRFLHILQKHLPKGKYLTLRSQSSLIVEQHVIEAPGCHHGIFRSLVAVRAPDVVFVVGSYPRAPP
jgi:hypothetical protein